MPEHAAAQFGSIEDVPDLPAGFREQFSGRRFDVGDVCLHAVVGGYGPPVVLVGGWPQFWWQWRHLMPRLASSAEVIAVDPRGFGLSDKPEHGYDTASLARDVVELMRSLGKERFDLVGHDLGAWIGYALAADHPASVRRLVLIEAMLPGVSPAPTALPEGLRELDYGYHFMFNRLTDVNERLVEGREDIFVGHQFQVKAASPTAMPAWAVDTYVRALRSPGALHASFAPYRALEETTAQNQRRAETKLQMPVLAVGGATSRGDQARIDAEQVADDVCGFTVPACGHYVPEEAPGLLADAIEQHLGRK